MSVSGDFSQLRALEQDLGHLGSPAFAENLMPAMRGVAGAVKADWNAALYGPGSAASKTGGSVSYDVGVAHDFDLFALDEGGVTSSTLIAEIGPKKGRGRQAGVVRLLENGSAHNAPHGAGTAALLAHEADFEAAIAFAEAAAAGRWNL